MVAHETEQTAQAEYGEVIDLIIIVVYFSEYTIQLCIMIFLLTLQMWRIFLVTTIDDSNVAHFSCRFS